MQINLEAIQRGYALKTAIVPDKPPETPIDADRIRAIIGPTARLRAICEAKGWDMDLIRTRSRRPPVVQARNEAVRLWVSIFPHHSLNQVANVFGLRHHTTVMHILGRTTRSRAKAKAHDTDHH